MFINNEAENMLEEALELERQAAKRYGQQDAFERVHAMLVSLGYDPKGEMFVKMRRVARSCGAPIDEDGNSEEVHFGTCLRCQDEGVVFETESPKGSSLLMELCGHCSNLADQ